MQLKSQPNTELSATLNAIRVETALSRYPVHRLAKKGGVTIDIKEKGKDGEILIRWEVSHNSKYGQPGPLAYKLDTLLVNRRIEEAARPIPKIIKLGSLREIITELGAANHGTEKIKKALRQNAGTLITAKIRYRTENGAERTLETDFTRYTVIFTGEKLPDGRKADAVYLILNEIYLQVISGAITRPLDYDYLKSLASGPQRFYELLSYQMYAALKNDRPRAKFTYSYYCTFSPQTRYVDWEQARKQMAKVHAPHKKSGYIANVEFQQTIDNDGKPDWIMLYTPGPKARAEFRVFTRGGGPSVVEVEPMLLEFPAADSETPQLQLELDLPPLVLELTQRQVTQSKAVELVEQHPAKTIAAKIEVFDWLTERQDKRVAKSPAGYLFKSITDDYVMPTGFESKAVRQMREEAKQAKERRNAAERRHKQEQDAREQAERQAIAAYWQALTPEQQAEHEADAIAAASEEARQSLDAPMTARFRKTMLGRLLDEHIRPIVRNQQTQPSAL